MTCYDNPTLTPEALQMAAAFEGSLMPIDDASNDPIQEVIPLLIDVQLNLDREISLESLARQFGYSPFHFHRFFQTPSGKLQNSMSTA